MDIILGQITEEIGIEMILLYGSYARGDFVVRDVVREWWTTRVFESDFDLFIITKNTTQEKNIRIAWELEKHIHANPDIKSNFSIIIEDIQHVNQMLEESRYFYLDIKNESIELYNSEACKLASPKHLEIQRKKEIQQADFDLCTKMLKYFLIITK